MATEDFTTYLETDPASQISVTSSIITFTNFDLNNDAYVYKDKGVDYFNGNFQVLATVKCSGGAAYGRAWIALTNIIDDIKGINDANGDFLGILLYYHTSGFEIYIYEGELGTSYNDGYTGASLDTPYYLKFKRDEAVGTYGTLYCYIYSDEARTTLLDTLLITLHTSKKDFRYFFGLNSYNSAAPTELISGTISNISIEITTFIPQIIII